MQDSNQIINEMEDENFSFSQLIKNWQTSILYALGFWKLLLIVSVLGAIAGLGYNWWKPVSYSARLTFVVEESKPSGGSIASALAGQFGFDIGSLTGTSGVLAGDNVLELLKSYTLIKKALLTSYPEGTNISLADRYAEVYHWKEKWRKSSKINRIIEFAVNKKQVSRLEDSLIQVIMKNIVEKELSISKPDKKLGFFELTVTSRDEIFSKLFCERLLKITTDFYIETKTRRLSNNVSRLQHRADSLGVLLDKKTYSTAEANRLLLDGNPVYSAPGVSAEISNRNKFIQSTVYGEIVKNLEVSKTALIQETPTVQIVDYPEYPLKDNKTWWLISCCMGAMIGLGVSMAFLILTKKSAH